VAGVRRVGSGGRVEVFIGLARATSFQQDHVAELGKRLGVFQRFANTSFILSISAFKFW
jgi:hypothetical protein